MAAGSSPTTRTASTCTPQAARCTHTFKIVGYSQHKDLGLGRSIRSTAFAVGGYQWCIRYYPNGDGLSRNRWYLELLTSGAQVRAHFDFRLVDHATGQSTPMGPTSATVPTVVFENVDGSGKNNAKGTRFPITRDELEQTCYLWDDCLIVECNVTVTEPKVEETAPPPESGRVQVPPPPESSSVQVSPPPKSRVQVPPSELSKNLGKLLEEKRGTDVNFKVKGEVFSAHKIILAMRSTVFYTEFYGPMAENTSSGRYVEVEDMDPDVFRALLHFIYTDTMPPAASMEDHDGNNEIGTGMIEHFVLVAADRYAMDRLKLICEDILCKSLNVENVAATLALAELHHCSHLTDACVEFIASANRLDKVVASPGYLHLRKICPSVVVDMFEKVTKWMHSHKR